MKLTVWLSEIDHNTSEAVGSKAARLGALLAAGFHVPPGFCLTSMAYTEQVLLSDRVEVQTLVPKRRFSDIQRRVRQIEFSPAMVRDVLGRYRQLTAQHSGTVAVRSSSTAEDLSHHSFAGLYETILHVADEAALLAAIRRCWASYWSQEAVLYREQAGLDHTQHSMAVLVQAMIQPELAGILFTQDPLHPEQNSMVVEFTHGSAEVLIRGDVKGQRVLINRETGQAFSSSSIDACLVDPLANQLVSLGLAVEQSQGGPQDIEWCKDGDNHLWVVQTRPITSLAEAQETLQIDLTDGWQRYYDEPFSPLGCDLAVRRHSYWVRVINDCYRTAFKPQIKVANGFLYYKPSWRSPGRLIRSWMVFWKIVGWLRANQIYKKYTETTLPAHRQLLNELQQQEISVLDPGALLAGFDASIQAYLDLQDMSYPVIEAAKTSVALLDRLCRLWFGQNSRLRVSDFLSGLNNLTVERDLTLHRLGQALTKILTPEEISRLDYAGLLALKQKNRAGHRFWKGLKTFVDRYGYVWADRYPRDPAWELDQHALVSSLAHAAQGSANAGLVNEHSQQKQRRVCALEMAAQQLSADSWLPLRWFTFRRFWQQAERFFPLKENRNHDVYQTVLVIREYAREIGRRLKAQQVLQSENDVFFLLWDEIRQILCGSSGITPDLSRQVRKRKHSYHQSRWGVLGRNAYACSSTPNLPEGNEAPTKELVGEPCSPGVATGPARLVSGLGELHRVQSGDIVVCRDMRPAWSPVFARAGGVLVEVGNLLSHGATLAREYGVPAVMNIPDLFQMMREGDRLTVDGYSGTVVIERAVQLVLDERAEN